MSLLSRITATARAKALGTAQALRSRLPLYGNDEARLATRHGDSLLDLLTQPGASLGSRVEAAREFGTHYRMPSSISRFADRIVLAPDHLELLHGLEGVAQGDSSLQRFVREVRRELHETHGVPAASPGTGAATTSAPTPRTALAPAPAAKPETVRPANPALFGRAQLDGERIHYTPEPLEPGGSPVCLVVGLGFKADALDFGPLASAKHVRVLDVTFAETPGRLEAVCRVLPDADVSLHAILADEVAQYTSGDQSVSDLSDAIGAAVVADLTAHARRHLHPSMDPVLALKISDQIYRQLQRVYASIEAVRRVLSDHPDARVVTTEPALAAALAHVAPTWLFGARALPRGRPVYGGVEPAHSLRDTARALRDVEAGLRKQLAPHVRVPASDLPRVVLATSSRLPAYRAAGESLRDHLRDRWNVHTLDFRPPPTVREAVARSPGTLALAVAVSKSPQADILADTVLGALTRSLCTLEVAGVPATVAFGVLRGPVLQIATSLFALRTLHAQLAEAFRTDPPAGVLLVPGRLAEIRTVAAAARAADVRVVDLQVMFVSTMARYKPPVADRFLVIDEQTRELYLRHYGLRDGEVALVGSLQLDREMAVVRAFDARTERQRMGIDPDAKLLTYGAQTHPREFILARALDIASYCSAHEGSALCVKLHPKQDTDLKTWLETELRAAHPTLSFSVELETDFARVLAATTVLVTHFSNVGVSAAAAGVPVVAMPTPDGLSGIDLSELGAAVAAADRDALHSALDALLAPGAEPLPYRERNPFMGDGGTLSRVEQALKELSA